MSITLTEQIPQTAPLKGSVEQTTAATANKVDPEVPSKPKANKWYENPPDTSVELTKLFISKNEKQDEEGYKYESFLPTFPDVHWDPLEVHAYEDRGLNADATYSDLFGAATNVEHLTPLFGTVLHGVELAELTDRQRDQLARLIAFRGVVFFRKQEKLDIHKQLELGRYYGQLHRHATTGIPKGATEDPELLDVHVVYSSEKKIPNQGTSQTKLWHSDVSYEKQPPSFTSLKLLNGPITGGDTLWSSGYGLYDALSPALQQYLESKEATHSAVEQAQGAVRSGNTVRREAIVSTHPIIRTNPITGWRSVYVNPGFTRSILDVPDYESRAILDLLFSLQVSDISKTVRWKWEPEDVAVWDNRVTAHSASFGFSPARRHAVRVTTHGEVPYFDAEASTSQQKAVEEAVGVTLGHKDGARPIVYND